MKATKRKAIVLNPYQVGMEWFCPVLCEGERIDVGPCPNRGAAIVEATKRAKAEEAREQ